MAEFAPSLRLYFGHGRKVTSLVPFLELGAGLSAHRPTWEFSLLDEGGNKVTGVNTGDVEGETFTTFQGGVGFSLLNRSHLHFELLVLYQVLMEEENFEFISALTGVVF